MLSHHEWLVALATLNLQLATSNIMQTLGNFFWGGVFSLCYMIGFHVRLSGISVDYACSLHMKQSTTGAGCTYYYIFGDWYQYGGLRKRDTNTCGGPLAIFH